jgi:CRP/FNR family transcriptional regulator
MKEEIQKCQCKECLVKSIPVFALNEEELDLLCSTSTRIFFRKGENIIKQGTFTQNIVFISSGIYMILQAGPLKRNEILKIDKGPKFVGIADVFANKFHSYSVTALSKVNICMIDLQGFQDLLKTNSTFAVEIIKTLSYSLVNHYKHCVSKTQKQLTALLADSLLYFSGHIFESDEFEVPLNRAEWGQYLGTTRETVTKIIHDLTDDRIIDIKGKNIKILNKSLLEKISTIG